MKKGSGDYKLSLSLPYAKLKKEMARRTGLSVPTVRKYLKMIEEREANRQIHHNTN